MSAWRAGRRVPEHLFRNDEPVATMAAEDVAEVVALAAAVAHVLAHLAWVDEHPGDAGSGLVGTEEIRSVIRSTGVEL